MHRRRNIQNRRQRSSLLFGGRNWMPHQSISRKDDLKKGIHFGTVVVWCDVDQLNIHFSEASVSAKRPFFQLSFSSNHSGAKSVVRHGIEWIPSLKQQRRPLLLFCLFLLLWLSDRTKHIKYVHCFKFSETFRLYGVVSRFLTAIGRNISVFYFRQSPGHFRCKL